MTVIVRLLGSMSIEIDQRAVRKFHSNKVPALLAYLLVEGAPVLRNNIAALLWDGYTSKAALANLRQTLTNLRRTLAPYVLIEAEHQTLYFNVDHPAFWSDVTTLQQSLRVNSTLGPEQWQTLLFTPPNDFLYNLPEIDSAPFQAWRAARRVAFRQQIEQLQQKMIAITARKTVQADADRQRNMPVDPLDTLTTLTHRLLDIRYPFLALEHEFVVAADRLQLVVALQPDLQHLPHLFPTIPTRPPSIQALLIDAWSALDLNTRTALLRCTIFRGGFTAAAAQTVADLTLDTLRQIEAHHLLRRVPNENTVAAHIPRAERFRLDEQVRHFAAIQLPTAIAAELQMRHAAYYLGWFPTSPLVAATAQETSERLYQEFENFQSAWYWAIEQNAIELLDRGFHALHYLTNWADGYLKAAVLINAAVARLRPATKANQPQPPDHQQLLARLLRFLGLCQRALGQYDQVLQVVQEALTLAVQMGDVALEIDCYTELGSVGYFAGDFSQARLLTTKALTLAQQHKLPYWQVRNLVQLGIIEQERALYPAALATFQAAADLIYQTPLPEMEEEFLKRRSLLYLAIGDFAAATRTLQQYLVVAPSLRNPDLTAMAISNCGLLALLVGDFDHAHTLLLEAHRLADACNNRRVAVVCLSLLAKVLLYLGEEVAAEAYSRQALQLAEAGAFIQTKYAAQLTLADLRIAQQQWVAAQHIYTVALRLAGGNNARAEDCAAHAGLAVAFCRQGDKTQALVHVDAALAIVDELTAIQAPQRIRLWCYQVLSALADERAPAVLTQAWSQVQSNAAAISDEGQRRSFLANVPFNRELSRLARQDMALRR